MQCTGIALRGGNLVGQLNVIKYCPIFNLGLSSTDAVLGARRRLLLQESCCDSNFEGWKFQGTTKREEKMGETLPNRSQK